MFSKWACCIRVPSVKKDIVILKVLTLVSKKGLAFQSLDLNAVSIALCYFEVSLHENPFFVASTKNNSS